MNSFLIKYKPLWISALITIIGIKLLSVIGFLKIPDDAPVELILIFGFWWLAIAFGIYKIGQLKNKKQFFSHLLTLIFLLSAAIMVDTTMNYPDNPATFSLLVVFWIYIFYLLSPKFFKKYRLLIIGTYSFVCFYFTCVRLSFLQDNGYREYLFPAFLFPIPIFIALWIYEQWKDYQSLKAEKSKAELALLKSQINPHFFFNTLNNLYALVVNQSKQAPEVIVKLSDMMRYTIYEGKKDSVPIEEEITYLKNYIELHELRHRNKVEIDFQQEVAKGLKVSPLLFIILLENAFKHGVETLTENAFIKMKLRATNDQISFYIENNFDPEVHSAEQGIGLENLKQRLDLIYPEVHDLTLDKRENTFTAELIINN